MPSLADHLSALDAPTDRSTTTLDARELPPPEPLQRTLETLPDLDDETVLLQMNDRTPKFLFPKLDDRGFQYATTETDTGVVTAIWRP